jgi:hypothetical protein
VPHCCRERDKVAFLEHQSSQSDIQREKQQCKEPEPVGQRLAIEHGRQIVGPGICGAPDNGATSRGRQLTQKRQVEARIAIFGRVGNVESHLSYLGVAGSVRFERDEVRPLRSGVECASIVAWRIRLQHNRSGVKLRIDDPSRRRRIWSQSGRQGDGDYPVASIVRRVDKKLASPGRRESPAHDV